MNNVKELVKFSHLTRKEFAELYKIPFPTLNRWLDSGGKPKEYIFLLLKRAVLEDFKIMEQTKKGQ